MDDCWCFSNCEPCHHLYHEKKNEKNGFALEVNTLANLEKEIDP